MVAAWVRTTLLSCSSFGWPRPLVSLRHSATKPRQQSCRANRRSSSSHLCHRCTHRRRTRCSSNKHNRCRWQARHSGVRQHDPAQPARSSRSNRSSGSRSHRTLSHTNNKRACSSSSLRSDHRNNSSPQPRRRSSRRAESRIWTAPWLRCDCSPTRSSSRR